MSEDQQNISDTQKHSAAHVLAAAVKRLYPTVKVGIGPATKSGFYYDFYFGEEIPEINTQSVEYAAASIISADLPFKQIIFSKAEASNLLFRAGEVFKSEILQSVPDDEVSFYRIGDEFTDLCRGPHVESTGKLGIIKIVKTEESYWREDESRSKMLRIYGKVFRNAKELDIYLNTELERRDKTFWSIAESKQITLPVDTETFLTDKGSTIINEIKRRIYKNILFATTRTVNITKQISTEEASSVAERIYSSEPRSYRELPLTYLLHYTKDTPIDDKVFTSEMLTYHAVFQNTNALGLIAQLAGQALDAVSSIAKDTIYVRLFTTNLRDPYVEAVSNVYEKRIVSHDKILTGDIDTKLTIVFSSRLNSEEEISLATMEIKEDSDLLFTDPSGNEQKSLESVVTFNVMNALEFLTKFYESASLPFAFAPTQILCIPTNDKQFEYSRDVAKRLRTSGFRVDIDTSAKSFNFKIRRAEKRYVPFIFVIGSKEASNKSVSVRHNSSEVGLISLKDIETFIKDQVMRDLN